MTGIQILVAEENKEIIDEIFSYLMDKFAFLMLMPTSFDDLFKEPFFSSSIAVIDYSFSNFRGLEALKCLKKSKPSLPIIFTTSHGTEELCMNVFKLGARDYFKKPFELKELIGTRLLPKPINYH